MRSCSVESSSRSTLYVEICYPNKSVRTRKEWGDIRICLYQDHYDWGLRAIKSVLVVAGTLRRADPEMSEDKVLMRALRDFNIPKITIDDMPVFLNLIGDLFPALDVERKRYGERMFECSGSSRPSEITSSKRRFAKRRLICDCKRRKPVRQRRTTSCSKSSS